MKGSNSRLSFNAEKRFSTVLNVQGGMVTDSDLVESNQIALSRDEHIARTAIDTGVPASGGMITWFGDMPALQPGVVVADGKLGHFRTLEPVKPEEDPLLALKLQADFPDPPLPDKGEYLIYADLWERPIFALQDRDITDAGLHGVETAYRTRTMVQLKSVEAKAEEDALALVKSGKGPFARTGNALVKLEPRAADVEVDDCDPCADQIEVEQTLPNALFRLEVTEVERDEDGKPIRARFAWSMENGSVIELNQPGIREGIERDGAVYQFFSDETESRQGWLPFKYEGGVSKFVERFTANDTGGLPMVRRWDGTADVKTDQRSIISALGVEKPKIDGGQLVISTPWFSLELALTGSEFLVGDYWLVEIRRFAESAMRLRLVGANEKGEAAPQGITHHFCPLMFIREGKPDEQPDELRRATSFPALNDIPASHISYAPPENCPVFGDSETVEEALDSICDLRAEHVHFTPPADCATLKDTDNVNEALVALCKADDNRMLRLMLRTMMDWGVICGIRLSAVPGKPDQIAMTGGTVLDRTGLLVELPETTINVNDLKSGEQIHGTIAEIREKFGEICLSVELGEEGKFRFHLSDPTFPYVASDMTVKERIAACLEGRKILDNSAALQDINEDGRIGLNRIHTAWMNRPVLVGRMTLDQKQQSAVETILANMLKEFNESVSEKYQERASRFMTRADTEIGRNIRGNSRADDIRRMELMVTKFGLLAKVEAESRSDCQCDAALPACPVHDEKKPVLVPIGCVTLGGTERRGLTVQEVCDLCCRKQSHNWRSYRYYFGDQLQAAMTEAKEVCCGDEEDNRKLHEILPDWKPGANDLRKGVGSPFWPPDPGVSNRDDRSGPDVRGLTLKDATAILRQAGVIVDPGSHVAGNDGDLFQVLAEALNRAVTTPIRPDFQAKPGDTVAFIHENGKVLDLFVTKQAFTWINPGLKDLVVLNPVFTDVNLPGGTVIDDVRIDGLRAEIDDLKRRDDEIVELKGRIQAFDARVAALAERPAPVEVTTPQTREIAELRAEIAGLKQQNTEIAEIQTRAQSVDAELQTLKQQNAELAAARDKAVSEVKLVREDMAKMETMILANTPVENIVTAKDAAALRESGITSKAQLDKATTATLTKALGNNRTSASRVITARKNFTIR